MKAPKAHSYRLRPGYGSQQLLIEFAKAENPEDVLIDLIAILASAGIETKDTVDLFMGEDVEVELPSPNGEVIVHKDFWGMIFVLGDNNQADILRISELLQTSAVFEKEDVDFKDYEL